MDLLNILQMSVAPGSPGVTVVQLSDEQTAQVQGVIQAPQTSVIQPPQVQTVQVRTFFMVCTRIFAPNPFHLDFLMFQFDLTKVTDARPPQDHGLNPID